MLYFKLYCKIQLFEWGKHAHMVVGFTTIYAISAY